MFVVAATLSNRMQTTRNFVRCLHLASLVFVNMVFSGKRTLKNMGGGPDKEIKELSDALVKRQKVFLDQATISTEITAFQILDDVAKISIQISDAGELSLMASGIPMRYLSYDRTRCKNQRNPIRIQLAI
jgi:hypothetical protein